MLGGFYFELCGDTGRCGVHGTPAALGWDLGDGELVTVKQWRLHKLTMEPGRPSAGAAAKGPRGGEDVGGRKSGQTTAAQSDAQHKQGREAAWHI